MITGAGVNGNCILILASAAEVEDSQEVLVEGCKKDNPYKNIIKLSWS